MKKLQIEVWGRPGNKKARGWQARKGLWIASAVLENGTKIVRTAETPQRARKQLKIELVRRI